jgi:hypothetical protein
MVFGLFDCDYIRDLCQTPLKLDYGFLATNIEEVESPLKQLHIMHIEKKLM